MGFLKGQKTTEGAGRSEGSLEVVCPMRKFQKWERCRFPRNSYRYCIPELLSYFSLPAPFSHPPLRNSEQALPRICPKPNQDFPSPARLTPTLRLFLLFPFSCRICWIFFLFYISAFIGKVYFWFIPQFSPTLLPPTPNLALRSFTLKSGCLPLC